MQTTLHAVMLFACIGIIVGSVLKGDGGLMSPFYSDLFSKRSQNFRLYWAIIVFSVYEDYVRR